MSTDRPNKGDSPLRVHEERVPLAACPPVQAGTRSARADKRPVAPTPLQNARKITMNFSSIVVASVSSLLLLVGLAGCGGEVSGTPAQPLVPVTGTVTLKNQPLAGASVVFTPRGGTPGTGAFGVTDAQGAYALTHKTDSPGVEPGEYVVLITKMAQKDGSPIPEGQSAADVEAIQIVPPAFSDPASESAANKITVSKETTTIHFHVP